QANDFQFAGQQTDATGLQYLRARYYDPATGTFLNRDPMAAKPSWTGNPFGYAGDNPVSATDASGMRTVWDSSRQEWTDSNNSNYVWTEDQGWHDVTNGMVWTADGGWTATVPQSEPTGGSSSGQSSSPAAWADRCAQSSTCRGVVLAGVVALGIAF